MMSSPLTLERLNGSAKTFRWLGILSLVLSGCSDNNLADLKQYVQQVKSRPAGTISPLPEIKPHKTFAYQAADLRSPFTPAGVELLRKAATQRRAVPEGAVQPNWNRQREVLERYPLDALNMVGLLQQGEDVWALIRAPDGILYRVQKGDHLGQNYGRIIRIGEGKIELTEIVPAAQGGWLERQVTLALAE